MDGPATTVSALIPSWVQSLRATNLSPRTVESYVLAATQLDTWLLDHDRPDTIDNIVACEGITTGIGNGLFDPLGDVTRWQMALFLTRTWSALGFSLPSGVDQGFGDVTGLRSDYQLAINQLAQLGITEGTSPTTFDPNGEVSRWQMALFLTRLYSNAGETLPTGADGFSDTTDLPVYAQLAINQLAALGITTGTTPTTFTPYGLVTREQMAAFLAREMRLLVP